MKRTLMLLAIFSSAPLLAGVSRLSLDEVLRLASEKTLDQQQIDAEIAAFNAETDIWVSAAYPQINASLAEMRSGKYLDTPEDPAMLYGSRHALSIDLRAPLYSFGRMGAVFRGEKIKNQMSAKLRETKIEAVYKKVIGLFGGALLAQTQFERAEELLKLAKSLYNYTKIEYEKGGRSKADFLRTESNLAKWQAGREKAENAASSSRERLKHALGLQHEVTIDVDGIKTSSFLMFDPKPGQAEPRMLGLKNFEKSLNEEMYNYRAASHLPQLSLFGSLGTEVLNPTPYGKRNLSVSDTFKPKRLGFTLGVSLDWTIYSGGLLSASEKQAYARMQLTNLETEQIRTDLEVAKAEAIERVQSSRVVKEASEKAFAAMALAFKEADDDFKSAALNLTQYLEILGAYNDAKSAVSEAALEEILAATEYKIIHGIDLRPIAKEL